MKYIPSSVQMDLRQLLVVKALLKEGVGALLQGRIPERKILLVLHLYHQIIFPYFSSSSPNLV